MGVEVQHEEFVGAEEAGEEVHVEKLDVEPVLNEWVGGWVGQ